MRVSSVWSGWKAYSEDTFGGQTLTRTYRGQSETVKDVRRQQIIQPTHPYSVGGTLQYPSRDFSHILLNPFKERWLWWWLMHSAIGPRSLWRRTLRLRTPLAHYALCLHAWDFLIRLCPTMGLSLLRKLLGSFRLQMGLSKSPALPITPQPMIRQKN